MHKILKPFVIAVGTITCLTSLLSTTSRTQPIVNGYCLTPQIVDNIKTAVDASSKPQECKRWKNLLPITKENPKLIWQGNKVLMVIWIHDCNSQSLLLVSCKKPGENYIVKGKDTIWVTAVPEIKEFVLIQNYLNKTPINEYLSFINYRLKEYLGLKPNSNYQRFVEVWVNVNDLERACIDPEVNDSQCNLPFNPEVDNMLNQYHQNGFPYTGLGYTYDWGNPNTIVGASEFVVKDGATVTVHRNQSTSEYLQGLTSN
ncbi:MAG: hypothetical protein WCO81_05845 [Cyanobacteriota bacterium ELA615]